MFGGETCDRGVDRRPQFGTLDGRRWIRRTDVGKSRGFVVVGRDVTSVLLREIVEAEVQKDAVEKRPKLRALDVPFARLEDIQESALHDVLGAMVVAQHLPAKRDGRTVMPLGQRSERRAVPARDGASAQQVPIRRVDDGDG